MGWRMRHAGGVEAVEVRLAPIVRIAGVDHYPGDAAVALRVGKASRVLENEERVTRDVGCDSLPVKRAESIGIKEEHRRTTIDLHISRRGLEVMVGICEIGDHLPAEVAARCGV